jgi:hypothetical protein
MRKRRLSFLVLLSLSSGCAGSANQTSTTDREELKRFLEMHVRSLGHRYDELNDLPAGEERKIRFGLLSTRDQIKAVDAHLGENPSLSQRGRAAVEDVRQTLARELELYEAMIAQSRFQMTEAERQREKELRHEKEQRLEVIGRMVDG